MGGAPQSCRETKDQGRRMKDALCWGFGHVVNVFLHLCYASVLAGVVSLVLRWTGLPYGLGVPDFLPLVGSLVLFDAFLSIGRLAWRQPRLVLTRVFGGYRLVSIDPEKRTEVP
jgi:hypothetical protein